MIRQEALNFSLAEILCGVGILSKAEIRKVKAPDLLMTYPLLGTLLGEAEVGTSWDDTIARRKLAERVKERFAGVHFKYVDFVLLIIYPKSLVEKASQVGAGDVGKILELETIGVGLAYRVLPKGMQAYMDAWQQPPRITWYPHPAYCTQIPSVLESLSKEFFEEYSKPEEIVQAIIGVIDAAAEHARNTTTPSWTGLWEDIARGLEIDPEVLKSRSDVAHLAAKTLFVLSAVTLIIYEQARTRYPKELKALPETLNFQGLAQAVERLGEVNYLELVDLLRAILGKVPSEETLVSLLSELYAIVGRNANILAHSGWETLAMIYQRLLSETYRKAYATFYTKLPAARLLSELSIRSHEDKVIDPAAGTGSLLLSTFYTRQWLYLSPKSFEEAERSSLARPVLDEISEHLLAKTYGLDALRAAVALSAGSLTVASLAIPRRALKLCPVPVGRERAGSLDLLTSTKRLMPSDLIEACGTFDLVIMNPPFTRSDRIPGLIGDRARDALKDAKLVFGETALENIFSAGLAKPFLALAEGLLENGGRIAAVLPNSILSRPAWKDVRKGILNSYTVRYIVISWAPGTPNFSSDTEFREILLVADKGVGDDPVKVVNLTVPIENLHSREIVTIADLAKKTRGTILASLTGKEDTVIAQIAEIPKAILKKFPENMYRLVAFSNRELLEWHISLLERCSTRLDSLLEVGSVIDHTDGLEVSSARPPRGAAPAHPVVWGSGCESVSRPITQRTDRYLIVEDEKKAKVKFWKRPKHYFSNLFTLRRGQLDTQCVLAFKTGEPVASNVWWPLRLKARQNSPSMEALLAFLNSTFGFVHFLGERLETRGLWVEFKKDHLHSAPIPDFRMASIDRLEELRSVLESRMTRFGDYLKEMAGLEGTLGSWIEASKRASETLDPGMASRAKLDLLVFDFLKKLDPNLEPPARLYQLTYAEIRRLREIMERRNDSASEVLKDKGSTNLNRRNYASLTKWI